VDVGGVRVDARRLLEDEQVLVLEAHARELVLELFSGGHRAPFYATTEL
jgi:hypothetical protein